MGKRDGQACEEGGFPSSRFEVLRVNEFTSDRKRMSLVVRAAEGLILFAKGADNMAMPPSAPASPKPCPPLSSIRLHAHTHV